VVAALRQRCPELWLSVSATTRAPRPGERDGVDYRFVTRERFAAMVAAGELLEHNEHFGNFYGTPREPVARQLAAGVPTLLEIEPAGARQVRAAMPDARLVFLTPPSMAELRRRLVGRATEAPELVAQRLARAELELAAAAEFDAVVVNDDVRRVVARLLELMAE